MQASAIQRPGSEPSPLVDRAVEFIEQQILNGHMHPGERLLEEEIAATLGISRSPVRDAIRRLVAEGLLLSTPHRGVYVRPLASKDARDLHSLFGTLIGQAGRLAAAHLSAAHLASLHEAIEALSAAAADGEPPTRILGFSIQVHRTIGDASDSNWLNWAIVSLQKPLSRYWVPCLRLDGVPAIMARDYRETLLAFRGSDPSPAEERLRSLVLRMGETIAVHFEMFENLTAPC